MTAFALLSLAGTGGFAASSLAVGAAMVGAAGAAAAAKGGGGIAGAKIKYTSRLRDATAGGDRSFTWRWPLTERLDAWSLSVPLRLARYTALGARLLVDATYLRAMLGSFSLIVPAAAAVLGAIAAAQVAGHAVPPSPILTLVILALGIVDASAGILAAIVFFAGTAAQGAVTSPGALRELMAVCALWFVVPLIASAARPLRRPPSKSPEERWERAADLVIASLIGAWAVMKIVAGLPSLSGHKLPIASEADLFAIAVLALLACRIGLETLAAYLYPERLKDVQPPRVPYPDVWSQYLGILVRTTLFVFVAIVAVGPSWQLWVGALLFSVPQIALIYNRRFPNIPSLYRVLPRGIVKVVFVLIVAKVFGAFIVAALNGSPDAIGDAFIILALPGLLMAALELFGREGPDSHLTFRRSVAGIAVLAVGVAAVLSPFPL